MLLNSDKTLPIEDIVFNQHVKAEAKYSECQANKHACALGVTQDSADILNRVPQLKVLAAQALAKIRHSG